MGVWGTRLVAYREVPHFVLGVLAKILWVDRLRACVGIMFAGFYITRRVAKVVTKRYTGADTGELVVVTLVVAGLTRRYFVAEM